MLMSKILVIFSALLVTPAIGAPILVERVPDSVELSVRRWPAGWTKTKNFVKTMHRVKEATREHMKQGLAIFQKLPKVPPPKPDQAVFWSGTKPDGRGGTVSVQKDAMLFGITAWHHLKTWGIKIPSWKKNPVVPLVWGAVSDKYATDASGIVHSVLGNRRPGNVYDNIEKPALMKNPKVTMLIEHDALTKQSKVVKP